MRREVGLHKSFRENLWRLIISSAVFIVSSTISSGMPFQSNYEITGVVTDKFSSPIRDVPITLYSLNRILQTKSDSQGRFRFGNLPADLYEMEAGYATLETEIIRDIDLVHSTSKQMHYAIALKFGNPCASEWFGNISYGGKESVGARVSGVVLADHYSRQPLGKSKIELFNTSGQRVFWLEADEKGGFIFENLPPGKYLLRASHAGYHDVTSRIFWVVRENQTNIVVEPLKLGWIRVCE